MTHGFNMVLHISMLYQFFSLMIKGAGNPDHASDALMVASLSSNN